MAVSREKFSSQVSPELLGTMREYIENRAREKPRDSVMAHFQASVERNRRLGEMLAK